jgi:hypothetical protein
MAEDEVQAQRARVRELLNRCTAIENERRMWKLRALATRKLLDAMIAMCLGRFGDDGSFEEATAKIREVSERADRVEADAWSRAVAEAHEYVDDAARSHGAEPWQAFAMRWAERFKRALK